MQIVGGIEIDRSRGNTVLLKRPVLSGDNEPYLETAHAHKAVRQGSQFTRYLKSHCNYMPLAPGFVRATSVNYMPFVSPHQFDWNQSPP